MKSAFFNILMGVALVAALPVFAPAQPRPRAKGKIAKALQWEYLGQANVDGNADHDRITVTRKEGVFRQIQFRVEKGPIEFNRVVVHFAGGQNEPIALRLHIAPGGESRAVDLPGQRRVIQSVEIWYERARPNGPKPRVTLYGR